MLKKLLHKLLVAINGRLLAKSYKAAFAKAKDQHERTGQKMWVVIVNGEFIHLPKKEFKEVWKRNASMKFRTINEWQKHVYEFTGNSR